MFFKSRLIKITISASLLSSILLSGLVVETRAADLVPTDDLSGGASVFVFRGSRKQPQASGAARSFRSGGASAGARREKFRSQVAAARKKKADAAKARAAAVARARARERNAKLKLSNTLAAKAETQMDSGDSAGAAATYRESLKANPNNAEAKEGLSEALTAVGIQTAGDTNNEAALTYFSEAVRFDPKNAAAFAKMGEIHDAKGRSGEAIANYEAALKLDPEFSSIYMPLGLAYAQAGKTTEAETYLTKAEAAGFASSESKLARAVILAQTDRNDEALAALEAIIKTEPQNAQAYFQKAGIYGKTNQADKSIAAYRDAVRIDPNYAAAWFELGVIYYNREDYKNALEAYQQAVKIEPENYQAQANLASTYRQLERYAEANAAYKAAEPGNTKNADFYSEWGYCLGKTNEWDKSTARLKEAREINPDAADNNNVGWGYYNSARWDKTQKKDAEATAKLELGKQYLEKAVEQDPKMDAAYLNLGATNNSLGDYKVAVDWLNRALTVRSDWVIALNQLGLAYRGSNDLTNALVQFQRVSTLDSNNAFGLVNLGEVYHLTGNKKEAKKVQDRLKKINPALAGRLNDFFSGKAAVDAVKQKVDSKIPRVPRIPY